MTDFILWVAQGEGHLSLFEQSVGLVIVVATPILIDRHSVFQCSVLN